MHILIVEDEYDEAQRIRGILELELSKANVELITTESEFRSRFEDIASFPPDIVVMDVMLRWAKLSPKMLRLPLDVSEEGFYRAGLRCVSHLIKDERTRNIPIVLYTVLDSVELKEELLDLPPNVIYLRKKADHKNIIRTIRALQAAIPTIKPAQVSSLKVFLCHSSGDKQTVRTLCQRLRKEGLAPWFDEESLLPGQDWQQEITKAVRNSDIVLVCLSKQAITKRGYIHKEIKYALDVADEQPENTIFIIPLKLEECDIPDRLSRWQWVSYFEKKGFEQLIRALRSRAKSER